MLELKHMMYGAHDVRTSRRRQRKRIPRLFISLLLIAVIAAAAYSLLRPTPTIEEKIEARVNYDTSVTAGEQTVINTAIASQQIEVNNDVTITASTTDIAAESYFLDAYVFVTDKYSVMQNITTAELKDSQLQATKLTPEDVNQQLFSYIYDGQTEVSYYDGSLETVTKGALLLIPASELTNEVKLLSFNGEYYLDTFTSGGLFRSATISGAGSDDLSTLTLNQPRTENEIFKINMTGVTALTRVMQRKLAEVGDPLYFSAKIGDFLSDADLTHISNEVSFKEDCPYSNTLFCSPPEFIETLKASGVDLVELTGNHNNDLGSDLNTATINQYRELGWATVGGGLNLEDARKPHIATQDGTTVAFLAYNYPDSPNGGAIAGANRAGANPFDFSFVQIEADIAAAKQQSDFVIVSVQYWECYAYPDGYVEYPLCDKPIGEQEAVFKELVNLGADMVVGSSAHQPQTFEYYENAPIYYGLGNMYFDQVSWPGTERGIVLTHYFDSGRLVQTKLTPTVYGVDLQPRIMNEQETEFLLTRLDEAR